MTQDPWASSLIISHLVRPLCSSQGKTHYLNNNYSTISHVGFSDAANGPGQYQQQFSLSCKCQSPLQRQQQPPPMLKTASTPAMLVDKEVPHTDTAVPFSILSLGSAGGKAII